MHLNVFYNFASGVKNKIHFSETEKYNLMPIYY